MSTESVALRAGGARQLDEAEIRLLRYAFGITVAVALALGVAWPLSYLTPVLVALLLAAPRPLGTRGSIAFLSTIVLACGVSLVASLTIPFPVVFFLVSALGLFWLQYAQQEGLHPVVGSWFTIAWVTLPIVAVQAQAPTLMIAGALILGTAVALVLVWLAYALFPDREQRATSRPPSPAGSDPEKHFAISLRNALAVLPIFLVFHLFSLTDQVLVLIFVAMLSGQAAFAKGFQGGAALLSGNAIGGLAAIAGFALLVIVPSYPFLILLTLLASLWFGARIFSTRESAPLFKTGMSTLLLVVGSTTTSNDDAGEAVYVRLLQLLVVVLYLVAAFAVIETLMPSEER